MIRNIIYDIGRVLIGFEWDQYIRRLFDEETAGKVTKAMWMTGYWNELDRNVLSEEEILGLFFQAGPDVREEIRQAYERVGECIIRRESSIPWIREWKERGCSVYFLSNYSEHLMRICPEALDFIPHMDGGVFSCDVQSIKPEEKIYRCLLEKYTLDPRECLFVDDREQNVAAAQRLGMHAVQYLDEMQAKKDMNNLFQEYNRG